MIRKLSILPVILATVLASSACSIIQFDTSEVKVIEKPADETPNTQNSDLNEKEEVLQADTEEHIKNIIEKRSFEVLGFIRDYDLEKLSLAIHPEKGVRFSPYGYVDVEKDLVFHQQEIKKIVDDSTVFLWGSYDGTGDPIELTFKDYWKKFIYDVDFLNAEETGYNKELGHGNSLNNSAEVYKSSIIVEYYFPGFDPQYEGMDWRSLRLVFEKANDTWYLVGIIHDQWTI
jgi:hypothetical protein